MITKFNPTVSNNRNQRHNFCAVSQKHMKEFEKMSQNPIASDRVVRMAAYDYIAKKLSLQDLTDTFDAVMQKFPKKFDEDIASVKEDLNIK